MKRIEVTIDIIIGIILAIGGIYLQYESSNSEFQKKFQLIYYLLLGITFVFFVFVIYRILKFYRGTFKKIIPRMIKYLRRTYIFYIIRDFK